MHTTEIEHNGRIWYFHHNGDFSGNVVVDIESPFIDRAHELGVSVQIPFEVLEEFVGQYIQSNMISVVEHFTGKGYLRATFEGWLYNTPSDGLKRSEKLVDR